MAMQTTVLSPEVARRRWSPRSTLMLAAGLSLPLWAALISAVVALR
jgi:hypothetical protein